VALAGQVAYAAGTKGWSFGTHFWDLGIFVANAISKDTRLAKTSPAGTFSAARSKEDKQ